MGERVVTSGGGRRMIAAFFLGGFAFWCIGLDLTIRQAGLVYKMSLRQDDASTAAVSHDCQLSG